jgi:ParB family chromosome partitioning protein
MAELVESVKRHGIITPLTLAPDGERFTIIAGERRYRAAQAAKLKQVPAQVREADGEALTLAVAENVIRADLTPVEEAEGTGGSSPSTATAQKWRCSSAAASD